MYKTILIPIDCSDVDNAILSHIEMLAKLCQSKIILLRAASYSTRDNKIHEYQEAEEYLNKYKKQLMSKGIFVETLICEGEPFKEVIKAAEEYEVELIAMSTHGHKFFQDLLLGSVADKIRHETNIPILLIKGA